MLTVVDLVVSYNGVAVGSNLDACQCIACKYRHSTSHLFHEQNQHKTEHQAKILKTQLVVLFKGRR
jgi:hypothetical protein